jgi:hypothetical protein
LMILICCESRVVSSESIISVAWSYYVVRWYVAQATLKTRIFLSYYFYIPLCIVLFGSMMDGIRAPDFIEAEDL